MSKSLVIPNVTTTDRGVYRCTAEIEHHKDKDATAKVLVFGECIWVKSNSISGKLYKGALLQVII